MPSATLTRYSPDPLRVNGESTAQLEPPRQGFMSPVDILRWVETYQSLELKPTWTVEKVDELTSAFKKLLLGSELDLVRYLQEVKEFKSERPKHIVMSEHLLGGEMKEFVANPDTATGNLPTFIRLLLSGKGMIAAWAHVRETRPDWYLEMVTPGPVDYSIDAVKLRHNLLTDGARRSLVSVAPEFGAGVGITTRDSDSKA